ncbi:uncharacterized protein LOC116263241 [Nymphaea colorata]|nr:uncharacterized protein LOC116263241 [Nymphaea colorata]
MLFCPTCGNMLLVQRPNLGQSSRFFCPTCPYAYPIEREISVKQKLKKKKLDLVFNYEEAMKNASKSQETCPRCGHGEAYSYDMQTRSADEGATIFFTCCNRSCGHQWQHFN